MRFKDIRKLLDGENYMYIFKGSLKWEGFGYELEVENDYNELTVAKIDIEDNAYLIALV